MGTENGATKAIGILEESWLDICNADIQISPDEWEQKLRSLNKKAGIYHSDQYVQEMKQVLTSPDLEKRDRNLILMECGAPEQLKEYEKRFEEALGTLMSIIEFAYKELHEFVNDPTKDEYLRMFVWFRLYLAAEAYHKVNQLSKKGEVVGFATKMPRVIFKKVSTS